MNRNKTQRAFLKRSFLSVTAFDRSVAVKVGYENDKAVNVYPEYEDCKVRASPQGDPCHDT